MSIANISKDQVEDFYKNPTSVDRLGPYAIVKKLLEDGNFVLMSFDTQGGEVKLMTLYLIHPSFILGDLTNIPPLQMLKEFMDKFGKTVNTPYGKIKILIDFDRKIFFEGVIDLPLYQESLKRIT